MDFEAVCPKGHRSFLDLRGSIDPDRDRGRCTRCGEPARLTLLPPVLLTGGKRGGKAEASRRMREALDAGLVHLPRQGWPS